MATYFDEFQSGFARAIPDFNLLKVGPHQTDPRAATSVVIAGMAAGLSVMLSLMVTEPARLPNRINTGETVAPPPAADKVTIVAASPRLDVPNLDVPCAEQTWPYIDRRCLTESTQKRPQPENRPAEAAAAPPIDARNVATAPVVPPAPAPAEPQASITQQENIAPYQREWTADSARIMQDEIDQEWVPIDQEWVPMMPPPEQYYRRERRRHYNTGRQIERQFRQFTRQLFPRF
jgi:hypothetical protein